MPRAWGSLAERDGKWYARVRIDGRRTWRLLRTKDGLPCATRKEAEPAIERLRERLEDAPRRRRTATLGATWTRWLEPWLDEEYAAVLKTRLTPHGAAQAESYLRKFATWVRREFHDPPMHEVGRAAADRWCVHFMEAGYRASYLRRVVNVLRKAWRDAAERGFVVLNPWVGAPIPRIAETHVPWISPVKLRALCRKVDRRERAFVTLVAETGLRPSEALALRRRDDVDLAAGVVHVRGGKTPAARRTVPLTPRAVRVIRALREREDGLLLRPRCKQTTLDRLKVACSHVHLPPLNLRHLRHVYASHLVVAGTPPTVVAALLGHADGGKLVLRLYGRWYPPDAQQRAVEVLAAFRATRAARGGSRATRRRPSGRGARDRTASERPSASVR